MAAVKGRGVVMSIAVILAIGAAVSIALYLRSVRDDAGGGERTTVIVAKRDIPSGTDLDPLIADAEFTTLEVPQETLVPGAITDIAQLQGQVTAFPILAGEQISTARLKGPDEAAGGTLGIPDDHQGIAFQVQPFQGVGGVLTQGDHVAVYATFKQPGTNAGAEVTGVSLTVVSNALVLRSRSTVTSTGDAAPVSTTQAPFIVTLALTPQQVQKVLLAQDQGTLWLALLPPGAEGTVPRPTAFGQLLP
jgi:pilus assembly protein CpaB